MWACAPLVVDSWAFTAACHASSALLDAVFYMYHVECVGGRLRVVSLDATAPITSCNMNSMEGKHKKKMLTGAGM